MCKLACLILEYSSFWVFLYYMLGQLKYDEGERLWNDFLKVQEDIVPASFTPDLINFYEKHFRWRSYYILIQEAEKTIGVMPIVNTNKSLVSLPHFSYGGLLSNHVVGIKTTNIINLVHTTLLKNKSGFYWIDISDIDQIIPSENHHYFIRSLMESEISKEDEKVTTIMEVPMNKMELDKVLGSNLRRKIRKSMPLDYRFVSGKEELLEDFYSVYLNNINGLRSMPYGKRFFKDLILSLNSDYAKFFVAYDNGNPIASALTFGYCNFYENAFFATLKDHRNQYISDRLHYEMIADIIQSRNTKDKIHKTPVYSFGRSTNNSGVFKYKNHWPVKNYPIIVETDQNANLKNGISALAWRSLPAVVRRWLGPRLIRSIY